MACVALYIEDGGWYRSQITAVDSAQVEVLFVDYGNRQKSPVSEVKIIEPQFLDLPPQAYRCCLTGIEKKSSSSWTEDDKMKLESATITKILEVNYLRRSDTGEYQVVLMEEGRVLNEMFGYPKSTGVAVPVNGYTCLPLPSKRSKVNVSWYFNPAKFFLSPIDSSAVQVSLI